METKDWITLVSVSTTLIIFLVTYFTNQRKDKLLQKREDELREKERTHKPQIEFNINCNFYGPVNKSVLVEVLLIVRNKGRVQQKFNKIILRLRGIKKNAELIYWEKREPRLNFPEELIKDSPVIPEGVNYFFVEPGEEQIFTYVTKIPSDIQFVLAYSSFWYDKTTTHDTERVFQVKPI
ncbi:MAG TPA: hypothetical protein VNB22_04170 [Pyrinomonadaceae bacterium]|nr:hypothetical protein [Pyrinomonadaceae bacterium]